MGDLAGSGQRGVIRVEPPPAPSGFDRDVASRGQNWLQHHPEGRPADYWRAAALALWSGFGERCGYAAMWIPAPGTVDHFVSVSEDRARAYDWANYRCASAPVNSAKQNLPASECLDPFEVEDDWFEVLLPSLQLVVTEACPVELRERAARFLRRTQLDHGENIVRTRRAWMVRYERGFITLDGLRELAPGLARAVEKRSSQG